jgi:hypothetical protein
MDAEEGRRTANTRGGGGGGSCIVVGIVVCVVVLGVFCSLAAVLVVARVASKTGTTWCCFFRCTCNCVHTRRKEGNQTKDSSRQSIIPSQNKPPKQPTKTTDQNKPPKQPTETTHQNKPPKQNHPPPPFTYKTCVHPRGTAKHIHVAVFPQSFHFGRWQEQETRTTKTKEMSVGDLGSS